MKNLPIIAVIVMLVSMNLTVGAENTANELQVRHIGVVLITDTNIGSDNLYQKIGPDSWKRLATRRQGMGEDFIPLPANSQAVLTSDQIVQEGTGPGKTVAWSYPDPSGLPANIAALLVPAPMTMAPGQIIPPAATVEPGAPPVTETPPQMEDMAGMDTGSRIWATDSSGTKWEYTRVEGDLWQLTGKQLPGKDPEGISGGYKYTSPELAGRFSSETQWTSWQVEPAAQPAPKAPAPAAAALPPPAALPAAAEEEVMSFGAAQEAARGIDVNSVTMVWSEDDGDYVYYEGSTKLSDEQVKALKVLYPDTMNKMQESADAVKPEEPKPEAPAPAPVAGTVTPSTQKVTEYTLPNTFLGNVRVQLTMGGDRIYYDGEGNIITSEEDINALDQMYSSEHEKYSPAYLGIFVQQYRQYAGLAGWSSLIFDEDFLDKWSTSVNKFFCDTIVLGGIDCWASRICGRYSEIIPSRDGILYTGGLGAPPKAIAHIEGRRSMPIITPNATYWAYTVTFGLTNPSTEEEMTYNIVFGGERTVSWWDTAQVLPGEMSASAVGASALYKVSMHNYGRVCILFDPGITDFEGNEKDKVCNDIVQYAGGATTPYTTTSQTASGTTGTPAQPSGPGANV